MKRAVVPAIRIKRVLALAAMSVLLLIAACSKPESPPPGDPGLMVRLSFSRNHVMIDNGNDFVWKDIAVEMNGKYSWKTAILPRGASSVPLSEFRDEAGNAFDPLREKPHRLTLRVNEGFEGKPAVWEW